VSPPGDGIDRATQLRVSNFLASRNTIFGMMYLFCKFCSALTPLLQWFFLCLFIGRHYALYGWLVGGQIINSSHDFWPNQMDVVFPKMAKCSAVFHQDGGDARRISALCELPMNNINQWTFFLYWWWLALLQVQNILSLSVLCAESVPLVRQRHYKSLVQKDKSVSIVCRLGFGDHVLLRLLFSNVGESERLLFLTSLMRFENSPLTTKPNNLALFSVSSKSHLRRPSSGHYTLTNDTGGRVETDAPVYASIDEPGFRLAPLVDSSRLNIRRPPVAQPRYHDGPRIEDGSLG
jgi:Innexin